MNGLAMKARRMALRAIVLAYVAPAAFAQLGDGDERNQPPPNVALEIPPAPVLSPQEEMATFVLPAGFRVELVAAEPLVHDPVVAIFDARGRLWVAEFSTYNAAFAESLPRELRSGQPEARPVGRVVFLEDVDGDGRMDRRTVYADNLNGPRAIGFVGDQVLIGDPPNLYSTRDRDGDGVMDEKTLLREDFGSPEEPHRSPNGLMWGRDNWLYTVDDHTRRRFENGQWRIEPMPVLGQWGVTQDDFGRLFYNSNSDQLRGDFIPSRFAAPPVDVRLPPYGVNVQIAADQSTWPIRPTTAVNRAYREGWLREDGTLSAFTAASGVLIYRGANFPKRFEGNAFVPEPSANLIKRNLLAESEGRITAMNAYQGVEFLASTDERFRPVFLSNGPDGALYIADFYRGLLEGYSYTTTYLRQQILSRRLEAPLWGMGRIWRVVHDGGPRARLPKFEGAGTSQLVKLLTDANGWTRDTAQRQIVEARRSDSAPALRRLFAQAANPRDRVSALWSLEGLGAFSPADALRGLNDVDARVRMAAIQASEPLFRSAQGGELVEVLSKHAAGEEPLVLAQAVLSVVAGRDGAAISGGVGQEDAATTFVWNLLPRAAEHPALADAVLTALRGKEIEVLQRLRTAMAGKGGAVFGTGPLLESLGTRLALAGDAATEALVEAINDKSLPQIGRLALMRGATRDKDFQLPEAALDRLVAGAADEIVRLRATELLAAVRERRKAERERPPVTPLTPAQQARFEAGKELYKICGSCHQADGSGLAGVAPALKGGRWAAAISAEPAIRILLNGKEGTPGFPAPMTPFSHFTDEQIADVLTFVRRSLGNEASAVEPQDVAHVRRDIGSRSEGWTDVQLDALMRERR